MKLNKLLKKPLPFKTPSTQPNNPPQNQRESKNCPLTLLPTKTNPKNEQYPKI